MMRLALLMTLTTAAGLGACAPVPGSPYGYAAPSYYDGGYAPGPYYPDRAYAPAYVTPGPAIIVGGERRWDDRERYRNERTRNERPRYEGGYRGNPNPPNRDVGRSAPQQNFRGNRPDPTPVAAPRPGPAPSAPQQAPSGHSPSFNPANPTASGDRG